MHAFVCFKDQPRIIESLYKNKNVWIRIWLAAPFWSSHKNAYGNIHSWHMNWTCTATDMTWSVSMPNMFELPRHAFVLHIHAMFHGVKCCSPCFSQIPLGHDWFFKFSIQQGFQLSLHGNGFWIACPSILSKKLSVHSSPRLFKSRLRQCTSVHALLWFDLRSVPSLKSRCAIAHVPSQLPSVQLGIEAQHWSQALIAWVQATDVK